MKYALAFLMLFSAPTFAEVQPFETQLPMICGDTQNIVDGLRTKYEEEIVMMSEGVNDRGDELYHSLWINYGKQTWTFIVVNKPKDVTCVIASGNTLSMFFPSSDGI